LHSLDLHQFGRCCHLDLRLQIGFLQRSLQLCLENRIRDDRQAERLNQRLAELTERFPHIRHHRQRWLAEHLAIGSHHSGQLPAWKQVLEALMSEGLLDAIFATLEVQKGQTVKAGQLIATLA